MANRYAYHRARSVDEACRMLAGLPSASILAGGTDLLVDIESGLRRAEHVVGIQSISELREISRQGNEVRIGACCTASEVEASDVVRRYLPELAEMVVVFASPQIRNRATVAGNICSAVACGDFPTFLSALGSSVDLRTEAGARSVPLGAFMVGNRQTVRKQQEMVTHVRVPIRAHGAGAAYQKFRRRAANSLAVASAAACVELDGDRCRAASIVLGAVGATPIAATRAAQALIGTTVDEKAVAAAAEIARGEAQPIADIRASADYRRDLIRVLVARALRQALARAVYQAGTP